MNVEFMPHFAYQLDLQFKVEFWNNGTQWWFGANGTQ
jgi:hypothetical protein